MICFLLQLKTKVHFTLLLKGDSSFTLQYQLCWFWYPVKLLMNRVFFSQLEWFLSFVELAHLCAYPVKLYFISIDATYMKMLPIPGIMVLCKRPQCKIFPLATLSCIMYHIILIIYHGKSFSIFFFWDLSILPFTILWFLIVVVIIKFYHCSPLSRQDLVSWKMALEKRQFPEADKKVGTFFFLFCLFCYSVNT